MRRNNARVDSEVIDGTAKLNEVRLSVHLNSVETYGPALNECAHRSRKIAVDFVKDRMVLALNYRFMKLLVVA